MTLEQLGPEIWIADGGIVSFFGYDYPTRMAVVRLDDGGLWLWSPVEATSELVEEVHALGPVRHLVSPNKLHHLFLARVAREVPRSETVGDGIDHREVRRSRIFGNAGRRSSGGLGGADRSISFHQLAVS